LWTAMTWLTWIQRGCEPPWRGWHEYSEVVNRHDVFDMNTARLWTGMTWLTWIQRGCEPAWRGWHEYSEVGNRHNVVDMNTARLWTAMTWLTWIQRGCEPPWCGWLVVNRSVLVFGGFVGAHPCHRHRQCTQTWIQWAPASRLDDTSVCHPHTGGSKDHDCRSQTTKNWLLWYIAPDRSRGRCLGDVSAAPLRDRSSKFSVARYRWQRYDLRCRDQKRSSIKHIRALKCY